MKKLYIYSLAALALLSAGCSKEDPFGNDEAGSGQFLKSALAVDLKNDEMVKQNAPTRADVNLDDFNVIFTKDGQTAPVAKYKYSEMPEVVTLPAGDYICTATLGEDRNAEWESPYFLGKSEAFEVRSYEITSYIDPIECRLENIKVSIVFDSDLLAHMSPDSYVEVKVGDNEGLKYGTDEAAAEKAGFFKHTAENSLVATFYGKIDGVSAVETKSMQDVSKGNHYRITFRRHNHDADPTGDGNASLMVDATVTVTDVERNVPQAEDTLLDDSERPGEDNGDPDQPQPAAAPTITGLAPVNLDVVNDGATLTSCVLLIHSSAPGGITEFTCDIESPTLTPDELASIGLASHLDLVNTPDDMSEVLSNLGFPVRVGGHSDAEFKITGFLGMLQALGAGEHHFVLKVSDANGTTEKVLKIKYN